MIIAIVGIVLGILFGFLLPMPLGADYALYTSMALLASGYVIVEGVLANLKKTFKNAEFLLKFLAFTGLSLLMVFISNKLGVPLYYGALFYLGTGFFDKISRIISHYFE